METKEVTENKIKLTAEYAVTGFIEDKNDPAYVEPKYFQADFEIAKVNRNWLVDQYVYPDAVQ